MLRSMTYISNELERLQFGELHFFILEALANRGYGLCWDRSGLVGKILNSQLRDLTRVWGAYRILVERGRLPEVPALARGFDWCETTEHFTQSEQGKQLFDPQPGPGPQDGSGTGANP